MPWWSRSKSHHGRSHFPYSGLPVTEEYSFDEARALFRQQCRQAEASVEKYERERRSLQRQRERFEAETRMSYGYGYA